MRRQLPQTHRLPDWFKRHLKWERRHRGEALDRRHSYQVFNQPPKESVPLPAISKRKFSL
jgi:hypothetical protein